MVKTCELLELLRCWRTRLETIGRGKWLHCVGVITRKGKKKKKEGGKREGEVMLAVGLTTIVMFVAIFGRHNTTPRAK